jgi:hypothetical protein
VSLFFVPWLLVYVSPVGSKYLLQFLESREPKRQFVGALLGILVGLMPWSIWMVAPVALMLSFPPELAIATWVFAAYSRTILAVICAVILVPVLRLLERSGMPAPPGAIWQPRR